MLLSFSTTAAAVIFARDHSRAFFNDKAEAGEVILGIFDTIDTQEALISVESDERIFEATISARLIRVDYSPACISEAHRVDLTGAGFGLQSHDRVLAEELERASL